MKTGIGGKRNVLSAKSNQKGIALLVVLASLVLISLLIIAFLSNVGTELKSSKVYANGSSVKLLAQSVVNLVQAEINDATHDGTLCWTSQPGMIRTFDNTGAAKQYFKLYSDNVMVGTGTFSVSGATPPTNWYSLGGIYVDLNQPTTISSVSGTTTTTTYHYPIVDGSRADYTTYTPATSNGTAPVGQVFALSPINRNTNTPQVSGFWIKNAPYQTSTSTITGPGAIPNTPNEAPMPVKWLYVLKDGSVLAPDSTLTGSATTFNNAAASDRPDNNLKQIVGRIAFWTDDETSKVNVNTAAEGAAVWDTPRYMASDTGTAGVAMCQPIQNEFQRYPGHPSTVSLSAVFGNLVTDAAGSNGLTYPENIYPLTPRITQGGSTHGTLSVASLSLTNPLAMRTDRLYDTVDEFMFQNNRGFNYSLLGASTSLNQTKLEEAKFFLTASSQAPDVNLFNQPRVSMWPVSSLGTTLPYRSPKDQLIAFCSTVNNFGYYFQRQDPNDPYTDLPATGTATGIGHNRQLLEYLRHAMAQQIPGFGGSFASKYNAASTIPIVGTDGKSPSTNPKECDQILTEIFDYIRCTNLLDQSTVTSTGTNSVNTYAPAIVPTAGYPYLDGGKGQVVPIVDVNNETRGFGRFPTLQQAGFIFYSSKDDGKGAATAITPTGTITSASSVASGTQMRALFMLQFFIPSMGYPPQSPFYQVRVTGLSQPGSFTWNDGSQMYPTAVDPVWLPSPITAGFGDPPTGGLVTWMRILNGAKPTNIWEFDTTYNPLVPYGLLFSAPFPSTAANSLNVPYTTATTATPPGAGLSNIIFTGGKVKVEIYSNTSSYSSSDPSANQSGRKLLQSITLNIPSGTFPLPKPSDPPTPQKSSSGTWTVATTDAPVGAAGAAPHYEDWSYRWSGPPSKPSPDPDPNTIATAFPDKLSSNDVIRMVVANPGDMRLVAARQTIDDSTSTNFFAPHPLYAGNLNMAHSLQNSDGTLDYHGTMALSSGGVSAPGIGGRLVPVNYDLGNGNTSWPTSGWIPTSWEYGAGKASMASDVPTSSGVFVGGTGTIPGDWDNGVPYEKDGSYINKPDEGDATTTASSGIAGVVPYFTNWASKYVGQTFFSPNRMIPSPGMLGSLPTGVLANKPWQTLLFRPGPNSSQLGFHPGLGTSVTAPSVGPDGGPPYTSSSSTSTVTKGPPDHLLMDLFTMPVVEPYAISSPLATSGRINMNYQIIPFTYITRNTGIQAALKGVQVISVPDADANIYKYGSYRSPAPTPSSNGAYRFNLDIINTLTQFDARFNNNDVFRSPSEICSIDLVPTNTEYSFVAPITRADMDKYWSTHQVTGDNSRERPYANLYPLLTTKSNTFTVHFRVQTLKKVVTPSTSYSVWQEGTDLITGEYRGSQTIERYVDANNATDSNGNTLPNFADPANYSATLAPFYKFRVVSSRQFAP